LVSTLGRVVCRENPSLSMKNMVLSWGLNMGNPMGNPLSMEVLWSFIGTFIERMMG